MSRGGPAGTARLWKGDVSAEVRPALLLKAPRDLCRPFRGTGRMMHRKFEPLVPAAAPLTGLLPFYPRRQADKARETDKSQSFGFVAVLVAPALVLFPAGANFVAAIAAAFAEFVAVALVAAAGDTASAFAAVAAVAFGAAGFGAAAAAAAAACAAAVATEGDAADATAAAVAAAGGGGDGDAFVAAASGGAGVAVGFSAARRTPGSALPCRLEKQSNNRMKTVACWA